jgi:hypothetical protein
MTYGIVANSSNNTLQIDSDRPFSYLKVTQKSTGTSVTVSDITDLVFIKPSSSSTAIWGMDSTGYPTYSIYANTTNTSADYLVLRPAKVTSPSTGYGLQLYNSDNQLAFDSGIFDSGTVGENVAYVSKVVDAQGAYGNYSTIYTGSDYLSVYACVNNSIKNASASIVINSFKWDAASTSIQYISQLAAAPPFTGATFYNDSSIILVKSI